MQIHAKSCVCTCLACVHILWPHTQSLLHGDNNHNRQTSNCGYDKGDSSGKSPTHFFFTTRTSDGDNGSVAGSVRYGDDTGLPELISGRTYVVCISGMRSRCRSNSGAAATR